MKHPAFAIPLPPTPVLETPRLILRPLEVRDAEAVQRLFPHWEIVRYLNAVVPWPYPADGAAQNMRQCMEDRANGLKFYWALTLKGGDDSLIGRIDLWPDDGKMGDMRGFWIATAYQGQGLMAEAADAVTDFAFRDLGWPYLLLTNAADNIGSHRIKEKQGAVLTAVTEANYVSGPGKREIWRLERAAWLARTTT
jgi:RimJ/RimL family protein N-acetyltransferase